MCGVPFHAYLHTLQSLFLPAARLQCEQLEDPALAQGLVKRGLIKIMTREP